MRMRIDESRHYNPSIGIDNFCVANILFDLIAGTDSLDLAIADNNGFREPLIATSLTKLTPDEVKAIPPKYRPY